MTGLKSYPNLHVFIALSLTYIHINYMHVENSLIIKKISLRGPIIIKVKLYLHLLYLLHDTEHF